MTKEQPNEINGLHGLVKSSSSNSKSMPGANDTTRTQVSEAIASTRTTIDSISSCSNGEPLSGAVVSSITLASKLEAAAHPTADLASTEDNSESSSGAKTSSTTPVSEAKATTKPTAGSTASTEDNSKSSSGAKTCSTAPVSEAKATIQPTAGSTASTEDNSKSSSGAKTSSTAPVSEAKATIQPTAGSTASSEDNSKSSSVAKVSSTTPVSETKATTQPTAVSTASSADKSESSSELNDSSATPVSEAEATTQPTAGSSPLLEDKPESSSGVNASSTTPVSEAKLTAQPTTDSTSSSSATTKSETGVNTSSKTLVSAAKDTPQTTAGAARLSLGNSESIFVFGVQATTNASQTKARTFGTGDSCFNSGKSIFSFGDSKLTPATSSSLKTPPLFGSTFTARPTLSAKSSASKTLSFGDRKLAFGTSTSKTPLFGVATTTQSSSAGSFNSSASKTLSFDNSKLASGATSTSSLFGVAATTQTSSADAKKESPFSGFKLPPGISVSFKGSLLGAKSTTQPTAIGSSISSASTSLSFGGNKLTSDTSAANTTPLFGFKTTTQVTAGGSSNSITSPELSLGDTKVTPGASVPFATSIFGTETTQPTDRSSNSDASGSFRDYKFPPGTSISITTPSSGSKTTTQPTTGGSPNSGTSTSLSFAYKKLPHRTVTSTTTPLVETENITRTTAGEPITVSNEGTDELPPLTFHNVHSKDIFVSENGSKATKLDCSDGGVAFSARPVNIDEKVIINFSRVRDFVNSFKAGFIAQNPEAIAYPNLKLLTESDHMSWIKELEIDFCTEGTVLSYSINPAGEVHFEVNGQNKGILLTEVDTSNPLWVYIYIGTIGTAVKFVDPRKLIQRGHNLLKVDDLPRPFPSVTLPIHKTKGLNVETNEFGEAAIISSDMKHGYVFVDNPIKICYKMYIQMLETDTSRSGGLSIGVTSWDPANLKATDLPEDPDLLIDRPEYWVIRSNLANHMKRGDYMGVSVRSNGDVRAFWNGTSCEIMRVNNSVPLWIFVNICGSTKKIRLLRHHCMLAAVVDNYSFNPKSTRNLTFHSVHSKCIKISKHGLTMTKLDGTPGKVFSARPVKIDDRIKLRISEVSNSHCLFLAGFIATDPATIAPSVLEHSTRSIENSWLGTLPSDFCTKGNIFSYYVTQNGDVNWDINGQYQEDNLITKKVNTTLPLWMYLYIISNNGSIELVNDFYLPSGCGEFLRGVNYLSVDDLPKPSDYITLPLHSTKGFNVQTNEFGEAKRFFSDIKHAYVFTAHPMIARQKMRIQILETSRAHSGSLAVGVTSWNPRELSPGRLPEDPGLLMDRPEYWVMREDVANDMERGDYLELCLRVNGDLQVSKNGTEESTVMNVNNFVPLWIFVNICGATRKIRFLRPTNNLEVSTRKDQSTYDSMPPVSFWLDRKDGIRISDDSSTVMKLNELGSKYVFSDRSVEANEKVCLRFVDLDSEPNIQIGFTATDPTLRYSQTPAALSAAKRKIGVEFCKVDNIFTIYFNRAGEVHFEVNGEYKGILLRGIQLNERLWVCVDIISPSVVLELVDPRKLTQIQLYNLPPEDMVLPIDNRPTPGGTNLVPLSLHSTKGPNIRTNENGEVERSIAAFNKAYVFSALPLQIEQKIFIQLLAEEKQSRGYLIIGLTSCDPSTLSPNELPEDPELLLDRPEFWIVRNDYYSCSELVLRLTSDGQFKACIKKNPEVTFWHVDISVPLWFFVDVHGQTRKIRLLTEVASESSDGISEASSSP